MLVVTDQAKQELKNILSSKVDDPRAGLRLSPSGPNQFGLSIDIELPGDHVVEHEGSKVLFVENELANNLEGITLDIQDTPDGARLILFKESES